MEWSKQEISEYLFACLAEGSVEKLFSVRASVCVSGHQTHTRKRITPNIALLSEEMNHVFAVAEMLGLHRDEKVISRKKQKTLEYMQYARRSKPQSYKKEINDE